MRVESEMTRHPLISNAIMFGHSRFKAGVIIEPARNPANEQAYISRKEFVDEIWSVAMRSQVLTSYNADFTTWLEHRPAIRDSNLMSPSYASILPNVSTLNIIQSFFFFLS